MLRYFITTSLILLGFLLFESAILSNILFLPAIPDFLLICVMYFSLKHGKLVGETTGFISGIMLDFLSGCPFGLNCLLRTVIGYFSGFLDRTFSLNGFIVPSVVCFCATFIKMILVSTISFFYPAVVNSYHLFSAVFGFELLLNTILAPFIFKFLGIFDESYPVGEKLN